MVKDKIFEEVRDVLEDGQDELLEEKKIIVDKNTRQVSIKIPNRLSLKAELNSGDLVKMVFNPKKEETKKEIENAKFVIYIK